MGHAPSGGGGVSEDPAGKDIEPEDIRYGKHHGNVLYANEGRGVSGSGSGKHDLWKTIREGLEDRGTGGCALRATEGDNGVDFPGVLKLFYNLGGTSNDKRIRLFPVWFDK